MWPIFLSMELFYQEVKIHLAIGITYIGNEALVICPPVRPVNRSPARLIIDSRLEEPTVLRKANADT